MNVLIVLAGMVLVVVFLGLNRSRVNNKGQYKEKYEEELTSVYDDDPLKQQEERENYIFENEC